MRARLLAAAPEACRYPQTLAHAGRVFAFAAKRAADGTYPIGYTALASQSSNPDDDAIWTDFAWLSFPRQLRPVGRGLVVVTFEDEPIPTADAPFAVVSDDSYVFVFRQSTNATLYVDRFVFDEVAGRLINVWETRYRRSRKFDIPLDRKDTFGSTDMEGTHFVEPTTELTFVKHVNGRFAAAILPTELPRVSRWQIFAENSTTGKLESYSIMRSTNGLFDLSDSLDPETGEVPPDATYSLALDTGAALPLASGLSATLYNRQELLNDEYGRPQLQKRALRLALAAAAGADKQIAVLDFGIGKDGKVAQIAGELRLPLAPTVGTSLLFVPGRAAQVMIPTIAGGPATALTFELWLNPRAVTNGTTWIMQSAAGEALRFGLALVDGVPTFSVGSTPKVVSAIDALEPGYWYHIAATWDGTGATVNVNGQSFSEDGPAPEVGTPPAAGYLLGGSEGAEGFYDEVRLWTVARSEEQILAEMCTTLTPSSPGWSTLAGYWKCDEPSDAMRFSVVANSAGTGAAANGVLDGARWARTSAPTAPSMPPIGWDTNGLTLCGTVLGFTATEQAPAIVDGGDSMLHLYYSNRGDAQMMAAHLSTIMARASYSVPWNAADPKNPKNDESGLVYFIARYPGAWMNQATLEPPPITITPDPKKPALATIVLRSTAGLTETWPKVPRDVTQLVDILNGEAQQLTDDPDAEATGAVMYDYTKVVVEAKGAQKGPPPAPGSGSNVFNAMPESDADNGMTALIDATHDAPELVERYRAGIDAWWQYDPPLSTIDLTALGQYIFVFAESEIEAYDGPLVAPGDVCLESWLSPNAFDTGENQAAIVFNKPPKDGSNDPSLGTRYMMQFDPTGRVLCAKGEVASITSAQVTPGRWTHVAASYQTDYGLQLGGARYLDAGNDRSLSSTDAVTVESWVRLDAVGPAQVAASKWSDANGKSWQLGLDASGHVTFTVNQDTGTSQVSRTVTSRDALGAGKWHHVAGVYTVEFLKETAIAFDKGSYVKLPQLTSPPTDAVTVMMWVKAVGNPKPGGQVLIQSVDPQRPITFALTLYDMVPTFVVTVNGNTQAVSTGTPLRQNDWIHIAGRYSAELGLELYIDGQSLGKVQAEPLSVPAPTAEETEAKASAAPRLAATAISAEYSVGGFAANSSFTGIINQVSIWNRGLTADEIRQRILRPPSASDRGLAGYWPFQDMFGTTVMDLAGTSNGEMVSANWIRVDKGQFAHKVFIDGVVQAFEHVVDPVIVSDTPVMMGSGYFAGYLQGAIGEVRLWKTGRMNWQIEYFAKRNLEPNADGLLSDWTFQNGGGRVVFDQKGNSNAVIRDAALELSNAAVDAMWIHTTFKAGWTIYIDGAAVPSEHVNFDRVGYGDAQCVIAAQRYRGAIARQFQGKINELRVWKTQRTAQQIRENMHVPVMPGTVGLVAYWPVSDGSSEIVADDSGFGANGTWLGVDAIAWIGSTAPVGIEIPEIRNTLGGLVTPYLRSSPAAAGAGQYGALQTDAYGATFAVYLRAYQYLDAATQAQMLFGTFKVGDLDVQYVGQAQMAPTLIGYIEGPPPVPSENLKLFPGDPPGYNGASSIALDETNSRLLTYTATRDTGFDMNISTKLGVNFETETEAGIGVSTLLFGFIANIGAQASFDQRLGWLSEAQVSNDTQVLARKTVELRGGWRANEYQIDNGVGGIYYPSNMGYALVRSGTADMFALRLKGTGALVSYQLRPNPDIPEDINIIMFKLRAGYVLNGTLDGWIGFQPEKQAYRNLQPGEFGSYFKPLEAYALKQLIAREHQQLKSYFDNFDAGSVGRRQNVVNFRPGDIGDATNDLANVLMGVRQRQALTSDEWKARMARRNMVNTYVWTADGGLYSEEEQFTAVREEQSGGSYDFTGTAGFYTEMKFSAGVSFELDAMFGGHIVTQAMKSNNESAGYTVNVLVNGESYIGLIKQDDEGELQYTDEPSPGKVRGYRFMTFYLAPSKRNFDDFAGVVDEDWLYRTGPYAGSFDPDALALRQSLANVNEVWRVLHRVTYVSRTPPQRNDGSQSVPNSALSPDAESVTNNYWLIDELPLGTGPNPLVAVSEEADVLLDALETNPVWGANLAAHRAEVKQDMMTYMSAYYGIS